MLASTLPRFPGDMQANFVGEQAAAWANARPSARITILAPHHRGAARSEHGRQVSIERYRYMRPEGAQRLVYPAILPNIRRNPLLGLQVPGLLVAGYRAAARAARQDPVAVCYAHWVMPQGLIAWQLKRRFGIPYVLQNHSSDLGVFDKLGRAGRAVAQRLLRDCLHFFCVNQRQLTAALALLPTDEQQAFEAKATVLPMGMAALERATAKAGTGYDIATIGRLSEKKGLHFLLEAAERLAQRGVRPRIGIAGDGEERSRLEAMVKHADVRFAGFLAGADKDRFLASAKRFAFPARAVGGDVEGLPVALLEALAVGAPVLASRDTNIELLPEWPRIRQAVTFVADPADIASLEQALEELLAVSPYESSAAQQVIGRYRWDRLIEEYAAPVEQALATTR